MEVTEAETAWKRQDAFDFAEFDRELDEAAANYAKEVERAHLSQLQRQFEEAEESARRFERELRKSEERAKECRRKLFQSEEYVREVKNVNRDWSEYNTKQTDKTDKLHADLQDVKAQLKVALKRAESAEAKNANMSAMLTQLQKTMHAFAESAARRRAQTNERLARHERQFERLQHAPPN